MIQLPEKLDDDFYLELVDNYPSLPANFKHYVDDRSYEMIKKIFIDGKRRKAKVYPSAFFIHSSRYRTTEFLDVVSFNDPHVDLQEEFSRIYTEISNLPVKNEIKWKVYNVLGDPCYDIETADYLFSELTYYVNKLKELQEKPILDFLLFQLLPYKLNAIGLLSEFTKGKENYFRSLLKLIQMYSDRLNEKNDSVKITGYTKTIAVLIYIFLTDLKLNQEKYRYLFELYFKNNYGSVILRQVHGFYSNPSDFMVCLNQIDTNDSVNLMIKSYKEKMTTLETNEKLSAEFNDSILVFGENIFSSIDEVRDMLHYLHQLTIEEVRRYLGSLNIGEITFNLNEQTKMYLKDTAGVKLLDVWFSNEETKTILKLDESPTHYLLFEQVNGSDGSIYGLSLEKENRNRKLMTVEKDKSENPTYKFLLGDPMLSKVI